MTTSSPTGITVDGYRIEPLGPATWDAFADVAERHSGMGFGGCWCTWFHRLPTKAERAQQFDGLDTRAFKQRLVEQGRSHSALVFDDDDPARPIVAWAQFGSVGELPNIRHRREWEAALADGSPMPDYRITCVFVDRRHRNTGLAAVAVRGAVALIAAAGGGLVEAYPHDLPEGRKTSASFLYSATRTLYERLGFDYQRPKGKVNCVMTLEVPAG